VAAAEAVPPGEEEEAPEPEPEPEGAPAAAAEPEPPPREPEKVDTSSRGRGGAVKKRKRRKPAPTPAEPVDPVLVEFRLADVHLAWVRVDRKRTAVLEPAAKMRLPPGKHRLEYRVKDGAPWRRGRDLEIDPDTPMIVRVGKGGLRFERG
jgi:hypothetical protein